MAVQLMKLRGVPEDEADEIRALLRASRIEFYETPEGNWGVSMPAIWLRDDEDRDRGKKLLDDYQAERARRAREEYEQQAREGRREGLLDRIRQEPLRFLIYLAIIAAILYFSTMPFLSMSDP